MGESIIACLFKPLNFIQPRKSKLFDDFPTYISFIFTLNICKHAILFLLTVPSALGKDGHFTLCVSTVYVATGQHVLFLHHRMYL